MIQFLSTDKMKWSLEFDFVWENEVEMQLRFACFSKSVTRKLLLETTAARNSIRM